MEEVEVPLEGLTEEIQHHAHASPEKWIMQVALSSAIVAVLAAIAALLANHHSNEALIDQIQASNQWNYYQAKGIKANMLATKLDILEAIGKPDSKPDREKLAEYKREQEKISEDAQERVEQSESHFRHHVILSRGVTLFQIAIAISAISVLARKRRLWYLSLAFAAIGTAFAVQGLLQ